MILENSGSLSENFPTCITNSWTCCSFALTWASYDKFCVLQPPQFEAYSHGTSTMSQWGDIVSTLVTCPFQNQTIQALRVGNKNKRGFTKFTVRFLRITRIMRLWFPRKCRKNKRYNLFWKTKTSTTATAWVSSKGFFSLLIKHLKHTIFKLHFHSTWISQQPNRN